MSAPAPASDALHTSRVVVRFYDTDQSGTVFFGNHIKWFDAIAIWELFKSRDIDWDALIHSGVDAAVVSATCEYHAPLYLDDALDVTIDTVTPGTKSLTFQGRIIKAATGEVAATCHLVYVFVHATERHGVEVPSAIREQLT